MAGKRSALRLFCTFLDIAGSERRAPTRLVAQQSCEHCAGPKPYAGSRRQLMVYLLRDEPQSSPKQGELSGKKQTEIRREPALVAQSAVIFFMATVRTETPLPQKTGQSCLAC